MSAPPVVLHTRVVTGCGGGPEKTILNSSRHLAATYRLVCAYLHPPEDAGFEDLSRKAAARDVPLVSIPDRGCWDWRPAAALLQVCREKRVSIWHGHDYKSNLLGLLLRHFWPMRLVTTVHGWVQHTWRTPLYYALDRSCLPFYERVLCVSADLHAQALRCGVPAQHCILLENGIDTTAYRRHRSRAEARQRLGLATDRLVVGAIGRLSAEKGFDRLLLAADRLLRAGFDMEVWIVGAGDEEMNLQCRIDELGRRGRFRLLGYRNDTADIYQALDVFALSSLREGLPNVLLEAMALEVPVVATPVGGVPRLVQDGVNGLLAASASAPDLEAALGLLLADADLRRRLAVAGRETVTSRHSFADRMERVRAIYDSLLGDGPRPPWTALDRRGRHQEVLT